MPRRNFRVLLGLFILSLAGFLAAQGSVAAPRGPLHLIKGFPGSHLDYENLNLLIDVMQHVDQNYVHTLSREEKRKFIEQAIEAGLNTLDEHSGYLNRREYASFKKQNEGQFGGIGINLNVGRDTQRLTIVSPIVGSPAYKAGVRPGDIIEKINGVSTEGWTSDDAVERITGKVGEPVTLTLRSRAGTLRDVTLTRAVIEVESVLGDKRDGQDQWDYLIDKKNRIGYIRLAGFGRKSADELKAVLLKLKEQGMAGLVLDLRSNPGGSLNAAVDIANLFIGQGRIVSVEGRNRVAEAHDAEPSKLVLPAPGHPMVVLVNGDSASASEIVAAALQDAGRAVVMGERSFGKGSVQNLIELEHGESAVKVTTAKYLRPSGKNIHRFPRSKEEDEWGVKPDVEVKLTSGEELEYFLARRDRDIVWQPPTPEELRGDLLQMGRAVGDAAGGLEPFAGLQPLLRTAAAVDRLRPQPRPFNDRVLERALEYLRQGGSTKRA